MKYGDDLGEAAMQWLSLILFIPGFCMTISFFIMGKYEYGLLYSFMFVVVIKTQVYPLLKRLIKKRVE